MGAWILFFMVIVLLGWLNQKHRYSGKLRTVYRELKELAERVRQGNSSPHDLPVWESRLRELERHPNEFNRLDEEIGLREALLLYLEKHYPGDERLGKLREAAAFRKDAVWGMKMRR
ncbi:hypothetical protein V3851_16920 [Paenibacillus sp. M1]|uniref:Uncharacterized protein n=1 Tax=Paenibacillus haidiansis TaxID=1574488 RepID=A0ABU7VUY0_9BACL